MQLEKTSSISDGLRKRYLDDYRVLQSPIVNNFFILLLACRAFFGLLRNIVRDFGVAQFLTLIDKLQLQLEGLFEHGLQCGPATASSKGFLYIPS